jgi:hypothetical protein
LGVQQAWIKYGSKIILSISNYKVFMIKVSEVLDSVPSLLGSQIEIDGCLAMIEDDIYIASDEDSLRNTHNSILIQHLDFDEKLFSSRVSALGGGDVVYCSPMTIKGILCSSNNNRFPIALTDIVSALVVGRHGEGIKVI